MKGKTHHKAKHAVHHAHKEEAHIEHHHYKEGGEVKKKHKKHGKHHEAKKEHHVEGKKTPHRADRYARGGRIAKMTPSEPHTEASKVTRRHGFVPDNIDREDD